MIYDFPEPSSPISQGDIFIGVPILDLTDDELPVIDDKGRVQTLPWEEFASASEKVSAIIAVRPTIAIVGTQECDAIRAPNITLFEVRPFQEVERKSKDTSKPSKWVPIITQHARVNQKWFYLPADERVGFSEKMGADFLTPIRIPRIALERLISFRKGRLNEVARQHFRERLAEFFRRYAYDEWYPLTREELAEYQKNHPDAEPFPWQKDVAADEDIKSRNTFVDQPPLMVREIPHEELEQPGFLDYLSGAMAAMAELSDIFEGLTKEIQISDNRIAKQNEEKDRIIQSQAPDVAEKLNNLYKRIAGDIHAFTERIEKANLRLEANVRDLTRDVLGYVEWASSQQVSQEEVNEFRSQIEFLGQAAKSAGGTFRNLRDISEDLNRQNITMAFNHAIRRHAKATNGLVLNIGEVESFCLKTLFLIDEKFGEAPP